MSSLHVTHVEFSVVIYSLQHNHSFKMSENFSKKYSTPDECTIILNMAKKGFTQAQIAVSVGKSERTI